MNCLGMRISQKGAAVLRALQRALSMGRFQQFKRSGELVFNKDECQRLFPLLTLSTSKATQVEMLLGMHQIWSTAPLRR